MHEKVLTTRRSRRMMIVLLGAGVLGLYVATMSRGAFPGLPARSLAWHLGLDSAPTLLDSLWGRLIRVFDRLPWGTTALWAGLFSAACGAACAALVAVLTMRVRYPLHDRHDPDETGREHQARLLAGLTAGLFTAVNIPVWILSTRSLPGAFHLLLLLLAAFLFSEYQRTGRTGLLYALGVLYGVGVAEFPTFWIFAPLAVLLVARAMLQRAAFRWAVLVRMALCMLPGLLMYLWNGWTLWSDAAVRLRGFNSVWSVIWFIWRDQWHLIVHAPQTAGFLLVMVLTVAPWTMLYIIRPKKPPWRFSSWQVLLRLLVLAVGVGVLFNAPGSPWRFFEMYYLMATPYLILAACTGHVVGELWVMGQVREHRKAGVGQPLRSTLGLVGLLMPVAVLVAGALNLRVADGRPGTVFNGLVREALESLDGRDVVISSGAMDDSLRLLAHEEGVPLTVVTVPLASAGIYRDYLSTQFTQPRQQALLQVGFSAFLQDFLATEEGLRRVAAVELADPLREYGYLVPDRLLFRVEPSMDRVDLPGLAQSQQAFWQQMAELSDRLPSSHNLAQPYLVFALRLASKVANNLGFAMVERGKTELAEPLFHEARRMFPENISALLNLLTLAELAESPEVETYRAEWEAFKSRQVDTRVMWSLGSLYGYVHNTGFLVRHGLMWAVSGKPRMAEAELQRAAGGVPVDARVKSFLARAFLEGGEMRRSAGYYREILQEDPNDVRAMMMMVQLALRAEAYAEAERLLARMEEAGVPPGQLRFERAILAYLRGKPDTAITRLEELVAEDREHTRAWALLAMLTADHPNRETHERALKALQSLRGASPDVRLLLAHFHMGRREFPAARAEIEQVLRMNPRLIRAWEMLVQVDYEERKRELAEDHVRLLLTLDPENYTGNLLLGSFQYARGQLSLAESSYRAALASRRDPIVLNDLAYLLMMRGVALEEARALIEEAVSLQPDHPVLLGTRAELYLMEGRLDEAEQDLQQALAAMPDHAQMILLAARIYAARGQSQAALELVESLEDRLGELEPDQQKTWQALLGDLR